MGKISGDFEKTGKIRVKLVRRTYVFEEGFWGTGASELRTIHVNCKPDVKAS